MSSKKSMGTTTRGIDHLIAVGKYGSKLQRFCLILAVLLFLAAIASVVLHVETQVGQLLGFIGLGIFTLLIEASRFADREKRRQRISKMEDAADRNPESPRPAWELASAKLEDYVERNIAQVSWIFVLIVAVMLVGFLIIGLGVVHALSSPSESIAPSVLTTCSGIVVEFIAATFLVIYRSTMEQAQKYVSMLERINAVGMSAQLLSAVDESDPAMRNKARVDLATALMRMYGVVQRDMPRQQVQRRAR